MSFLNVFPSRLSGHSSIGRALPALVIFFLFLQGCASSPSLWRIHPGASPNLEAGAGVLARLIAEEYTKALESKSLRRGLLARGTLSLAVGSFVERGKGRRFAFSRELENALMRKLKESGRFSLYPREDFLRWEERLAVSRGYGEDSSVRAAQFLGPGAVVIGSYEVKPQTVVVRAELVRAERPRPRFFRKRWRFFEPRAPKAERRRLARVKVNIARGSIHPLLFNTALPPSAGGPLPRPPEGWLSPPLQLWHEVIRSDGRRERGLGGGVIGPDDTLLIRFSALRPTYLYLFTIDQEGKVAELFPGGETGRTARIEASRPYMRILYIAEPNKIVYLFCLASPVPFDFRGKPLEGLAPISRRIEREGRILGGEGLALPPPFYQQTFWFLRSEGEESGKIP